MQDPGNPSGCPQRCGAVLYLFKDKLKDTFFNSQYEDELFKLLDIGRLAWDLVRWPVDYVRALLP